MSNLLEKATIILTPTAYDNSKVLCAKPSEPPYGDFDFSRNSAATRVNAQGLVENVQTISGNLVTNGDFANGSTDWSLGTGWSIGTDKALCDGTQTSSSDLTQALSTPSGKLYKITYTISEYTSGSIFVRLNSGNVTASQNTVGTFTEYISGEGGTQIILRADANFIGSITNISVKEIIDDTNLPRINYEGGCGSWLFEPQSTNSVFQSNLLNPVSGGVVTPNAAISPDGTTNAIKVNFSTGVNSGSLIYIGGSSATASTQYTFSFYAKNFSGDGTFRLRLDTDTQATLVNQNFTATSDWVRYTSTFTTDAAASSFGSGSRFRNDTNNNEVLFFGMQLEQQSFATSYIPTSGSTVTRNRDLCNNGGSLATINSTEGVLYTEIAALANDGTNRIISVSDGTTANRVSIVLGSATNQIRGQVRSSGTSFDFSDTSYNTLNNNKIAISYKLNDFSMWINGTKVATDTSGITPIGMNEISFNAGGAVLTFFGKTKCLAVWKEALTDAELTSLTTI